MTRCFIFSLLGLLLVYTTQADTQCNLRAIFKTPRRSNYDEFELMERSNFNDNANPKTQQDEPKVPNSFSNARVLLKLGDYKNAVKKNNNNVNTRITLAGPNHNNYYQPPFVHPYYPPFAPPIGYSWNPYHQNPRMPQYTPQYYVVNPARYPPRYPVVPPQIPIMNPIVIPSQNPSPKPKYVLNEPIFLDNSVIQHIPIAQNRQKNPISNGLNTMTVIPKILIDTVAQQPTIVEKLGTEKPVDPAIPPIENMTMAESSSEDPKLENVDQPRKPEVQNLKMEEPKTQNLTEENSAIITEGSPDIIQNITNEDSKQGDFQIVEITPQNPIPGLSEPPIENNFNVPEVDNTVTNQVQLVEIIPQDPISGLAEPAVEHTFNVPEVDNSVISQVQDTKEPNVVVEQEILVQEPVPQAAVETVSPDTPSEISSIHNMNHPRVLHPVKLSNNIENVEIVGAGNVNISLNGNSSPVIEHCRNIKDFELVNLLKKSLVPFINLKTNEEPKLLVSYPIINNVDKNIPAHPSAIIVESLKREPTFCAACTNCGKPRKKDVDIDHLNIFKVASLMPQVIPDVHQLSNDYSVESSSSSQSYSCPDGTPQTIVSGYEISSASGYYEDPTRKIIYRKPTEITVVPPQVTENIPSYIDPAYVTHSQMYPPHHHDDLPEINYVQPRPEPQVMGRSKLVELLKYLLSDISFTPLTHSRPAICPYCTNMIRLPTVVRCPHCLNYHDVSRAHSSPEMLRSFCPQCTAARPIEQQYLNPPRVSQRCPYCAKYVGELNQLS